MRLKRKVRLSVRQAIQSLLANGSLMGVAYNVYGESDLRNLNLVPVFPYVYLLDFGVKFELKHVPAIIIQLVMDQQALELGTRKTYHCTLNLHIIAKDRGERDDLAFALIEDVDSFALYDYDTSDSDVVETVRLDGARGHVWTETTVDSLPTLMWQGGSLDNWTALQTGFWVTTAMSGTGG